jgi:hypothetical protein
MRITPATLLKIARDTVMLRERQYPDLLAVYLHGSVLEENPLLGGTTDIDLFFVHINEVAERREIERLTDEVHLDISHHSRSEYRRTMEMRLHPWLGPTIFNCRILYDPQHFMDLVQANVRGQFDRPDYVLERARSQAEHARQMWFTMYNLSGEPDLESVDLYLRAVEHVAHAVTSLSGAPLTERRFTLNFAARAEAIGKAGLYPGLLGLLGGPNVDANTLTGWLAPWKAAYKAVPVSETPPRLHPDRLNYYTRAFEAIIGSGQPLDVLWPMLRTWCRSVSLLPAESPEIAAWLEVLEHLGMLGAGFKERVTALDAYLDMVEEALEEWGRTSGAEYELEML